MKVELRGIIQYLDQGHKHVDVVVDEGEPHKYKRLIVGVDIKVNRGRIMAFLSDTYGVPPGQIVWPDHIVAIDSDIG